jgi:hypothetical protein
MNRHTNIFLASLAVTVLLSGGTFGLSAADLLHRSCQGSSHSLLGSIYAPFPSLILNKSTLIAAADEDSEDMNGEKKDGKDGKNEEEGRLKELWDSVLLG